MPDTPPSFQPGDVLRFKGWYIGAPLYKVVAMTPKGSVFAQTCEQRPMTRLIQPGEFNLFEKVEKDHEPDAAG